MADSQYINLFGVDAEWEPWDGNSFGPKEKFGLIDEISATYSEESIDHTSRQCGQVGTTDRTASSKIKGEGSITSPEVSPKMISRAFKGPLTETPVAEATATENPVTIDTLGIEYAIGLKHISNVHVWDTAGGTGVEYTEGTDYTINYTRGTITAIDGGAITAGSDVYVIADNEAYNDWHVAGFSGQAPSGKLTVHSCAVETGMDVTYVFELIRLSMDGDYNMVSAEDFLAIPLKIDMMSDSTITDPNKSKLINIYGADTVKPDGQ